MDSELVAIRLPHATDVLQAINRVWRRGSAVLPLPADAPEGHVERVLTALRPSAIVQPGRDGKTTIRRLPGGRPVSPGTVLVVSTSGTSGEAKGVELSRHALDHSVHASLERLDTQRGDRWLVCLPLHHVAGIQAWLRSRALGSDPVVQDGFDVDAVAGETRAKHVSLVPTMLARLLDAGADLSRYRTVLIGGAPLSHELAARAQEAGVRVVTSYGMTETCGGCVYDGRPLKDVEVSVDDDGRIWIRGPVLMRGYRFEPHLTAARLHEGWLRTSDLGRLREDGTLEVLGRSDDMIITGGENVLAGAVAEVLRRHPGLADAAVVGRPDPEWGEVVVAVCVPADPDVPPSLQDLRDHVRTHLPAAAAPRERWLVESLPRNELGKISRQALQRLVTRNR